MSRQPLLSVGLFVYNGQSLIKESLDSLLGQTLRDFELIISDNGSTDGTEDICRKCAKLDSRIRYYRNHKNMGAAWNIRRVFGLARGKYFKWAACDDLCAPDFFKTCVDVLERDPSVVLAHSRTRIIDQRGTFLDNYHWPMKTDSDSAVTRFSEMLLNDHLCFQIFGVMRRKALLRIPPQGTYVNSDGVLLARMAFLGKFYEAPEYLFMTRRHEGQSSQTPPLRVKQRRFRLTNRFGTLPCPEWWDPQKANRITFPEWRQLWEYFLSILRAPIRPTERLKSFALLVPWTIKHFRRMMKDMVIAADQVLYNLQMSRLVKDADDDVRKLEEKSA
jgi:glycosyltransferase involved in cell wall biosynthesis